MSDPQSGGDAMDLKARQLEDTVFTAPQISEDDIAEAARQGFKAIINNRPDGEEPGQLDHERAAAAAARNGLAYAYVPVDARTMGPAVVDAFARALAEVEGPVLLHCRTGTRSTHLWAMAATRDGRFTPDEVTARAARAGYDLEPLRPVLAGYAAGAGR
ncbi:TIGR01244 family sulfur transferase [Rhodocista pekingensis]|uniref:TIGR01244 family sulfur transferase n=1 Tax=Rhodocista pekingensis TaxID=201185 RepID=A0ABW2KRC4_9PROT